MITNNTFFKREKALNDIASKLKILCNNDAASGNTQLYIASSNATIKKNFINIIKNVKKKANISLCIEINFSSTIASDQIDQINLGVRQALIACLAKEKNIQINYHFIENLSPNEIRTIIKFFPELEVIFKKIPSYLSPGDYQTVISDFSLFNVLNIFVFYEPVVIIINNFHLLRKGNQSFINELMGIKCPGKELFVTVSYESQATFEGSSDIMLTPLTIEALTLEEIKGMLSKWFSHQVSDLDSFSLQLHNTSNGDPFEILSLIDEGIQKKLIRTQGKVVCWSKTFPGLFNTKVDCNLFLSSLFEQEVSKELDFLFVMAFFNIRLPKTTIQLFSQLTDCEFDKIIHELKLNHIITEFEQDLKIDFYNQKTKDVYLELRQQYITSDQITNKEIQVITTNINNIFTLSVTAKYQLYLTLNTYYFNTRTVAPITYNIDDFLALLKELESQSKHSQLYKLLKYLTPKSLIKNIGRCSQGKEVLFLKAITYKNLKKPILLRKYMYYAIYLCNDNSCDTYYIHKIISSYACSYKPKEIALIFNLIIASENKLKLNPYFQLDTLIKIQEILRVCFTSLKGLFINTKSNKNDNYKLDYFEKILETVPQSKNLFMSIIVPIKIAFLIKTTQNKQQKETLKMWRLYVLFKFKFNRIAKLYGDKKININKRSSARQQFLKAIYYDLFFINAKTLASLIYKLFDKLKNKEETLLANAAFHFYVRVLFYSGAGLKPVLEFYKKYDVWCTNHVVLPDHKFNYTFFKFLETGEDQGFFEQNDVIRSESFEWGTYANQIITIFLAYFFDSNYEKAVAIGKKIIHKINLEIALEYFEFKFFYTLSLGMLAIKYNTISNINTIKSYIAELKQLCSKNTTGVAKIKILETLLILIKQDKKQLFLDLEYLEQHPNELYRAVAEELYFLHFKRLKMHGMAREYLKLSCDRYNKLAIKPKINYYLTHEKQYTQFMLFDYETQNSQKALLSTLKHNIALSEISEINTLLESYFLMLKETLDISYIAYIVPHDNEKLFVAYDSDNQGRLVSKNLDIHECKNRLPVSLIQYSKNTREKFNSSDTNSKTIMISLGDKKYVDSFIIYPIYDNETLLSIVYLEKKNVLFNTDKDIEILDLINSQFAITYNNIQLKKQNKALITTLEKKVESQVEQIRKSDKEAEKSREMAQKTAAQSAYATLARGIAHEIRNPMAMMLSGAELVLDNIDDKDKVLRYMGSLKDTVIRLKNVTNSMLQYGHAVSSNKKNLDIKQMIQDVKVVCAAECKKNSINIITNINHKSAIFAEENSVYQALLNIMLNSIQAIEKKGTIEIETQDDQFKDKKQRMQTGVSIKIKDNGKGIAKDKLDKIYDPFFSTKYGNAGLGLSIVFKTIDLHNGNIVVKSKEGEFTMIILYFPSNATPMKSTRHHLEIADVLT